MIKNKTNETVPSVRLSDFSENPDNPQKVTEEAFLRLVGKLKRVPEGLNAQRIAYVTDDPRGDRLVLSGNKRLRALREIYGSDGLVPASWFQDITSMSQAERQEFIIDANVQEGEWDAEKLLAQYGGEELGELVGEEALANILKELPQPEGAEEESVATEDAELKDLRLDQRMESAKYVFFSFSGGRDSTRAIYLCARRFLETGKKCQALYVESPCEFPDVVMHIRRVCKDVGLPLHCIHPDTNYIDEYAEKGKSPDTIFMDCVEKLINRHLDRYIKEQIGDEDYILVRGGKAKQKTSRSHTAGKQEVKSKPNMIIYNPLFYASKEQLDTPIPEWPGYAAGFIRTACWCCPFQKKEQYEALRRNYPLLFEEMKKIVAKTRFVCHKGDEANQKKFRYWEGEGVEVKFEKPGD